MTAVPPPAERAFGEALGQARHRAARSQQSVADAMVEAGFETFRATTVAQIEMGRRGIGLGEAIELAQILGMDLLVVRRDTIAEADALIRAAYEECKVISAGLLRRLADE